MNKLSADAEAIQRVADALTAKVEYAQLLDEYAFPGPQHDRLRAVVLQVVIDTALIADGVIALDTYMSLEDVEESESNVAYLQTPEWPAAERLLRAIFGERD